MFNIEKSNAAPAPLAKGRARKVYTRRNWPWQDMKAGDVVKIEDEEMKPYAKIDCHVWGRRHSATFVTRTIDGILHIWRTA